MLLYLSLFSSVLFLHRHVCYLLNVAFFHSSFHHHVSPLLLFTAFFPHALLHALGTSSLKFPHKFGSPASINSITFYFSRFLISISFRRLIFSHCLSHYIPYCFLIYISAMTSTCQISPWIAVTFLGGHQCCFLINTKSILASFSSSLNVTFFYCSFLGHVFDASNSFFTHKILLILFLSNSFDL